MPDIWAEQRFRDAFLEALKQLRQALSVDVQKSFIFCLLCQQEQTLVIELTL